jgi:hypothetical protein
MNEVSSEEPIKILWMWKKRTEAEIDNLSFSSGPPDFWTFHRLCNKDENSLKLTKTTIN